MSRKSVEVPLLQDGEPALHPFDAALQKENARLQQKIVALEARIVSHLNKIAALEKELHSHKPINVDANTLPADMISLAHNYPELLLELKQAIDKAVTHIRAPI